MKSQSPAWLASSLALLLSAAFSAGAQGTFQNLGFESAAPVPIPGQPDFYYFAQAFPGWTGYVGGVQPGLTAYDNVPMSAAGFAILDHGFTPVSGGGLIDGNFTAFLTSGAAGAGEQPDTTLAQTGLVPFNTRSLLFRAYLTAPLNYFDVTLGGVTLSLVPVQAGANYTLYGADIHSWAGQTAELAFTALYPHPFTGQIPVYLDSIQFSPQAVPEPGIFGLGVLGAILLGWRARR
jgi:hypothetical protein